MLLPFLALTTLTQTSATVTYTNNGARLERLLPELSKASGLTLEANPLMRDSIVALRLDKASNDRALKQIATVTHGIWRRVEGKYVLNQDVDEIEREQQARIEARATRLQASRRIAAQLPDLIEKSPKDTFSPTDIATAKLLQILDVNELAAMPARARTIYSTRPAPLQKAAPQAIANVLNGYAKDLDSTNAENDSPPIHASAYAKADLIVESVSDSQGIISIRFRLYGGDGHIIVEQSSQVCGRGEILDDPPPLFPRNPKPLKIDPETLRLIAIWSGKRPMTDDVRNRLHHPLEHDPDEWAGAIMVALAEKNSAQLVAGLTDGNCSTLSDYGVFDYEKSGDYDVRLQRMGMTLNNGWLTLVAPIHDSTSFEIQDRTMDRHKLEAFVDKVPDDPDPGLLLLASASHNGLRELIATPQAALYPGLYGSVFGSGIQMLSLLTEEEAANLAAGRSIPVANLSSASQAAFTRRILGGELLTVAGAPEGSGSWDILTEPTNAADGPIPTGAYITLSDKSSAGLLGKLPTGEFWLTSLKAVAGSIAEGETPGRYRVVVAHDVDLRWYVTPNTYWSFMAHYHETTKNKEWLTIRKLPKDMQADLEKLVKAARDANRSNDGGAKPPR